MDRRSGSCRMRTSGEVGEPVVAQEFEGARLEPFAGKHHEACSKIIQMVARSLGALSPVVSLFSDIPLGRNGSREPWALGWFLHRRWYALQPVLQNGVSRALQRPGVS